MHDDDCTRACCTHGQIQLRHASRILSMSPRVRAVPRNTVDRLRSRCAWCAYTILLVEVRRNRLERNCSLDDA